MFGVLTLAAIAVVAPALALTFFVDPPSSLASSLSSAAFGLIATAVPGSIAYLSCRTALKAQNRSVDIPYVPPVAEQIAALPAEDILVRGSDRPAATPEELLRAVKVEGETERSKLVRPIERSVP